MDDLLRHPHSDFSLQSGWKCFNCRETFNLAAGMKCPKCGGSLTAAYGPEKEKVKWSMDGLSY